MRPGRFSLECGPVGMDAAFWSRRLGFDPRHSCHLDNLLYLHYKREELFRGHEPRGAAPALGAGSAGFDPQVPDVLDPD